MHIWQYHGASLQQLILLVYNIDGKGGYLASHSGASSSIDVLASARGASCRAVRIMAVAPTMGGVLCNSLPYATAGACDEHYPVFSTVFHGRHGGVDEWISVMVGVLSGEHAMRVCWYQADVGQCD